MSSTRSDNHKEQCYILVFFWIDHSRAKTISTTVCKSTPCHDFHKVHPDTSSVENPLLSQLSLVESQLLTLQNVAVATSTLSRSRRNNSVQTTSLELLLQSGFNLPCSSETLSVLLLNTLALLVLLVNILTSFLLASSA